MEPGRFVRSTAGSGLETEEACWFVFLHGRLVLIDREEGVRPLSGAQLGSIGLSVQSAAFLGYRDGVPYFGAELEPGELPASLRTVDLRQAYELLPETDYSIAGFAAQITHWDRTTQFCPVCGSRTEPVPGERAKRCVACDFLQYPRVSPAIIVLIHRPGQVLLTRQRTWPPNRYSLVAGFVEPGESLEECLRREVAEEVGVVVDQIRYLGSQSWPFPHQLMVGFLARYQAGDLVIDPQELEHAAWFDLDALPDLPPPMSISRRIIDWHLRTQRDPSEPFPAFDSLAP